MIATVIEGAHIYDGTGTPSFTTDVALAQDRIALIGDCSGREALERIDGRGLALAPGFIDAHSHSDELWLVDGRCAGKILQGVTTEIAGNCGSSVAPLLGLARERRNDDLRPYGIEADWTTLDEFYGLVERSGVSLNVASLVGLGTTRRCVRGDREGRLDAAELRAEGDLVRAAVEQGALGVSSGLIYTPSRWADTQELIEMSRTAGAAGAPRYASHLRSEGDDLWDAVQEAIEVGREAEVAVQFSHHKAAWKRNWGKVHRSLEMIDRARAGGLTAYADVYPYVALWTELSTILPEDALFGGREQTLARLRDPATATAIALRLELDWGSAWHDIMIASTGSERNAALAGSRLDEVAAGWNVKPPAAAIRLLAQEELDVQAIFFALNEEDVATVLSADFTCVGSDASARAIDGPTARGVPHPRTFGTFPRVIGRYVRRRGTLDLAEAIRRMTSLPASVFGLRERGTLAPGQFADLVLFDADALVDTATYDAPMSYPRGIEAVWVNGVLAARSGSVTAARAGRVLRAGRAA